MKIQTSTTSTLYAKKTKTQFLNAAEEVFCLHGYEGTTIRAIAKQAKANFGTIQYYWGNKQELFRDLFEQRFLPLHTAHLLQLKALKHNVPVGERPDVKEVLQALIDFTFAKSLDDIKVDREKSEQACTESSFRILYACALTDSSPHVINIMRETFNESIDLFFTLMKSACPNLSVEELDWRINCIMGAHLLAFVKTERLGRFSGDKAGVELEQASELVLHFLLHGITAPPLWME